MRITLFPIGLMFMYYLIFVLWIQFAILVNNIISL